MAGTIAARQRYKTNERTKELKAAVAAFKEHGLRDGAADLGISIGKLQRRLSQAQKYGLLTEAERGVSGTAAVPTEAVLQRKVITQADEITRLNKALKEAHRAANTEDIIRDMLGTVLDTPIVQPDWMRLPTERKKGLAEPEVPVLLVSDLHAGEVVEKKEVNGFNEFNMAIAEERVYMVGEKSIMLSRDFHTGNYPGLVLAFVGDNISGGLHEELRKTDEDTPLACALKVRDWYVELIKRLVAQFGRLYVPCACGNHGRDTVKPEFKKYYRKNYDWLIYQMLIRHFADDPRIQFDDRPSNDVHFQIYGHRFYLCHGDMMGTNGGDGIIGAIGPIMRGTIKMGGQSSAMGLGFDTALIGHYHQRLWLPRVIVNNAIKGFDEFAMKRLGAIPDRVTQCMFYMHHTHGMTAKWDVYLTPAPPRAGNDPWVSWKE